jgi:uncharacterized protein (TIGR03437 family)
MNFPVFPTSMPNASYRHDPHDPRAGSNSIARLALLLTLAGAPVFSQVLVDTFAGGIIRSGVAAQDVALGQLAGIAFDPSGNLVLCDQTSNVIRRIRPDGIVETLAGNGTTGFSGDGGPALNAALNQPALPRFDAQGNLYFSDTSNFRIRRVDARGVISTVAGSGVPFRAGMDLEGPALSRSLDTVNDMAVDPVGNVFIIVGYNGTVIRRVTTGGRLEIYAGIPNPDCYGCTDGDNGPARAARIAAGYLAADGKGNLFLSELTSTLDFNVVTHIRRIGPDGIITRFAGYGPSAIGTVDDDAKPALDVSISRISGMAADSAGNLYFVQSALPNSRTGPRIRRIDTNGVVNTIFGPDPFNPGGIAVDAHGAVAFTEGSVIRDVTGGQATPATIAGASPKPAPDGTPARDAWLLNPVAMAFNRAGDLFVAEAGSCLIRKIGADGRLATAAGTGKCGIAYPLQPNTTQDLASPAGIVADNLGRFYMLDTSGNTYLIAADGKVSPAGFPPTLGPGKIAIDGKDRVCLMSMFNLIRISPDGKQETIVAAPTQAGVPPQGFGPISLGGIGTDPAGAVYFTGTYLGALTDYVFRVNDDGTFTTMYGSTANPLQLSGFIPSLAVDSNATVWLGNTFVNASGAYSLGNPYAGYSGDGGPAQSARFNPSFSTFSPNGNLYVLDASRIRKLTGLATAKPTVVTGGIVNAVSYAVGAIAPGELISIFGSGFAAATLQSNAPENGRMPWVLGRTKVLFDGYPGAIVSMTPAQINVFVPYWVQPGKSTTVTVQTDATVSAPQQVPVADAAPGLATTDQTGSGQGAILNQDASLNFAGNPAARGSVISLFGTGEGLVAPQLLSGDLSISTPFSTPVGTVAVTIGGQPAEITYAGAAPLAPIGIFQINVKIPAAVTTGPAAVTVSVGGIATPKTVTVAVR